MAELVKIVSSEDEQYSVSISAFHYQALGSLSAFVSSLLAAHVSPVQIYLAVQVGLDHYEGDSDE